MRHLSKYFLLPKETTAVELEHVRKINRVALLVCWLHVPLFVVVAILCNTSVAQALGFGTFLALGPTLAQRFLDHPRHLSLFFGFTAMCLGALLVHLGQGPVQIEMHFHFFASLALLTVWGNPTIIWVAAVTVALHHALFWLFWPSSVFNYDAELWVVGVHAAFVVVESVAAAFIARNFFDNVIGLDKIVQARTKEISDILDNVAFGMFIANKELIVQPGYSRSCREFFNLVESDQLNGRSLPELLNLSGRDRENFEGLYEQIFDGHGLEDFAISQLPTRFECIKGTELKTYGLVGSIIRDNAKKVTAVMFCISDETSLVQAEADVRRSQSLLKILSERGRFKIFADEIHSTFKELRRSLTEKAASDENARKLLHTMKGGFGVYGLSDLVHDTHRAESTVPLRLSEIDQLEQSFRNLIDSNAQLLNLEYGSAVANSSVEIEKEQILKVLRSLSSNSGDKDAALCTVRDFLETSLMPSAGELIGPIDALASQLAGRFGKRIKFEASGLNLKVPQSLRPLFATLPHLVRNSLDHGIEPAARRGAKPAVAALRLKVEQTAHGLVIHFSDDGAGIQTEAVRKKAIAKGVVDATRAATMTAAAINELIFEAGLSTASAVNDVSGRGIGMAAVKEEAERLGGRVTVTSTAGQGTTIQITVPLQSTQTQRAA